MGFGDGQGQLNHADVEGEFEKYHGSVLQSGGSICRIRSSHRKAAAIICLLNLVAVLLYFLQSLRSSGRHTDVSMDVSMDILMDGSMDSLPNSSLINESLSLRKYTEREIEKLKEASEARQAVQPVALIDRLNGLQMESLKDPVMKNDSELQRDASFSVGDKKPNENLDGGKLVLDGPQMEDGIIPGRPLPAECNAEAHADYDGAAVRWGPSHPQESAADCCQACIDQARNAREGEARCNLWVFCPAEEGCFAPDIYEHKEFECWLKHTDTPRLNFKGRYPPEYRQQHPKCPQVVAWTAGVIL